MIKERKKGYDAPMVELIKARVEKGFVGSAESVDPRPQGAGNEALTASGNSYGGSDFTD